MAGMNVNKRKVHFRLIRSVRGKFLFMGLMGIIVALVIGLIGMTSINRNATSSDVVALVNAINLLQSENVANDSQYQYYIDEKNLSATLENLEKMQKSGSELKKAGSTYASEADDILSNVEKGKDNYTQLLAYHSSRGYAPEIGKYSEYLASSEPLNESFTSLVNNNVWTEIPWTVAKMGAGKTVDVDGKSYVKHEYSKTLPEVGKRDSLIFRVGGTFTYKKDYYIKNIYLCKGAEKIPVDLSKLELTEKSGDGLGDAEITEFGGEPAIKVTGIYDAANDRWEEVSTTIRIGEYNNIAEYPDLKYELYMDKSAKEGQDFQFGGAISDVYGFSDNLAKLDNLVKEYSQLVVDGSDVQPKLEEIYALMAQIEENIPEYTTDPSLAEASAELLNAKKGLFEELKSADDKVLAIKMDNAAINSTLTSECTQVLDEATADMNGVQSNANSVITIVLAVSVVVLALVLIRVTYGISRSVSGFKVAIDEIAGGNISARANAAGRDEFAMFADSLNSFLDILEGTMSKVKDMTNVLSESGVALEGSATKSMHIASTINQTIRQVSEGAMEQAKDVENSTRHAVDIQKSMNQIFESVNTLSEKTDEMDASGNEATGTMKALTLSSDSTTKAFVKIADQVRKTDESVGEIQNAISLIQNVAMQITLLSLNASIEAARAGAAGKGFAVVASEISNLAEKTNQSATMIEDIISMLSEESNRTVETINEVTDIIQKQKSDIDNTSEIFSNVSTGIVFTKGAVNRVLTDARFCENASETVVNLMTNLSAISEENAASAETTSNAMEELNAETTHLADTSAQLKQIADNLKSDLGFFQIEGK